MHYRNLITFSESEETLIRTEFISCGTVISFVKSGFLLSVYTSVSISPNQFLTFAGDSLYSPFTLHNFFLIECKFPYARMRFVISFVRKKAVTRVGSKGLSSSCYIYPHSEQYIAARQDNGYDCYRKAIESRFIPNRHLKIERVSIS